MHNFWNHTMLDTLTWCVIETNVMKVSFGKSDVFENTFKNYVINH